MTDQKIDTNFALTNKVAIITELFGQKGAKLVLVDKSEGVRAVADEFAAKGIESLGIAADITNR